MDCPLIWMKPKLRSSALSSGSLTVPFTVRPGRLPSVGSFSPALMDTEVLYTFSIPWISIHSLKRIHKTGYVQSLLSWKFFVPLSRLSYAAYLIHPIYIKAYYSSMRKPLYYTVSSFLTTYSGIVIVVFLLASITSAAFEIPFLNLDKLLIQDINSPTPRINSAHKGMLLMHLNVHKSRSRPQAQ